MPRATASNFNLSNCVNFDGIDDYVSIPDNNAYSYATTSALTVSAWMNPATLSQPSQEGTGYTTWLSKDGSGTNEWIFRFYSTGNSESRNNRISFYIFNAAGGLGDGAFFEDVVVPGEWIHVLATVDASKNIRIYKNGVLRNIFPTSSITPTNTASIVKIGAGASNSSSISSYFNGMIDDVRIYNKVLNQAEILDVYNRNSSNPTGCVGWWKLDTGSGTTATDSSVTANNGTLSGSPAWATSLVKIRRRNNESSLNKYYPVNTTTNSQAQRRLVGRATKSLSFNGTTQYASITDGSQTGLDVGLHDFMIGGWFKICASTGIQTLFEKYQGSGYCGSSNTNIGWEVIYRGDQATKGIALRMQDGTNTGITVNTLLSTQNFADGNWHHIILDVARGSTAQIWVDGQASITPNSVTALPLTFDNTGSFIVGVRQDATAGFLKGNVSDVFLYDFGTNGRPTTIALQAIIENIYYRGVYSTTSLVSRWTFDNVATDSVGNNTLTLTGSPTYSNDVPLKVRTAAGARLTAS